METKFKSKSSLEITVEGGDKMIDTMDWFNDMMSRSEFVIRPTIIQLDIKKREL